MKTACDDLKVDLKTSIGRAQDTLLAKLEEQASSLKVIEHRQTSQQAAENVQSLRVYYSSLSTVSVLINRFVKSIRHVAKSQLILQSLLVAELGSREEQIHEAHRSTFHWIFDGKNDADHEDVNAARIRFERWLSSSSEVFWINGKAGSGKSTLMKYLASHEKTEQILERWAGAEKLVCAKHFFWNSGSSIQKSLVGLMQSLLCQILRECPELISFASTRRWQADESSITHKDAWTRKELTASIANIMARGQLTSRFCFFIDGLDEYADENAGEHHELIGYLDLLAQSPQVKLCVSSRPWTVFKDRYAERKDLTLVLEELTLGDMHRYVDGILNNDERFRQLVDREPQALELVFQIRDRAEGVFLWVYLVVRSLLKGLSEHDDAMELERRLSMIPSDLNTFFLKIFQNLDPTYEREAMRAFHMATVAPRLPLMVFRYLAKEVQNPRYAFEMTAAELKVLSQRARDNVNKWCRDLLEVKDYLYHGPGSDARHDEVGFLHRTVRDFLLTREMQAYFANHPVCQSSARRAICMCYLAEIKSISERQTTNFSYAGLVANLMRWARKCETIENHTPTDILDEFGRVRNLDMEVWVDRLKGCKSVLHHAIDGGLRSYVSQCFDRDPKAKDDLLWAFLFMKPQSRVMDSEVNIKEHIDMFVFLLEKGVDPNQPVPRGMGVSADSPKTTWELFLKYCYSDFLPERYDKFAEPWIRHGADMSVKPMPKYQRLDVRACLSGKRGHRTGVENGGTSRFVDERLLVEHVRPRTPLPETPLPASPLLETPLPPTPRSATPLAIAPRKRPKPMLLLARLKKRLLP